MSDPRGTADKAPAAGRKRKAIFGDRKKIVLRMAPELNERLLTYCVDAHIPANTYVTALIESALGRIDPGSASLKRIGTRGEDRVMLTLRIARELQDQLTRHCQSSRVIVNTFICGLIQKDLTRRGN